jgi:4-alpha-glucanotransferase
VDYSGVGAAKLKGLRLAYEQFRTAAPSARRAEFERFRDQRGTALERFAVFEVLRRRFPQVWWDWPEPWRRPSDADLAAFRREHADEVAFHEFTQWVADAQLHQCSERARAHGLRVGLYLDVAVGVDAGGADAWSDQEAVLNSLSVGAPPDVLNTAGQNWGLAGFNPAGLEAKHYEPFRRMVQAVMRHAGAIRIDHVLGLKRLFLIPHGMSAQNGAYVRLPFEPLLAVIAQESAKHRCIVIGEDLGTVPEGFRETMADWGLWSYLVLLFERNRDGSFKRPEDFGRNALVTFSTHDLPTFTGWVSGHDLVVKRALGMDPGESDEDRYHAVGALWRALGLPPGAPVTFEAVVEYLARTGTRMLVISMEDALGIVDQPNVPGTVREHPNWRRRLPLDVEELFRHQPLRKTAQIVAAHGRSGDTERGTSQPRG